MMQRVEVVPWSIASRWRFSAMNFLLAGIGAGEIGGKTGYAVRPHMESDLRAPPDYVLGRFRPFCGDQIVNLAGREAAAEILAEVGDTTRIAENAFDSRAIGAGE